MQVAFIANDDRGKMGPFWLPRMGNESEWAVKAGETRKIQAYITGFGVREMSSATPVEVRILGARLKEVSRRPESERRAIFTALVGCEDAATAQEECQDRVRAEYDLPKEEERLISSEGITMSWPPLGNN